MFPIQHTIFILIKVLLAFSIIYIYLPSKIITFDEEGNDWSDKIFISLTHSNLIIIVLVHLLVLLRIYETISLFIAIVVFIILFLMYKSNYKIRSEQSVESRGILTVLLDLVDGKLGVIGGAKKAIKSFFESIPKKIKKGFIHIVIHPFDGILLIILLAIAAVVRFRHSFTFLYYGASDCYVHLAWTKYLGINSIYQDGVYPYGYEAIVSAMQKLFFIDPADIIRFLGAMGSVLLVLSIYYILRKSLKNQYLIIFIGVAAYVLGTELPNESNNIWRQMSALPQEYAALFILPGMHFLNLFFNTNRKKYLLLASEVLAITIFIHFYAAIFLVIGYILLSLFNLNRIIKSKIFLQLLAFMSSAAFLGLLPIIIALSLGMKFHALSFGFVAESATINVKLDWTKEIFKFAETNQPMRLLFIFSSAIFVYAFIRIFFRKSNDYLNKIKLLLALAVLCLFTYTQVRSADIGFPTLMDFSRASTFLGIILVVLLAMTIYIIEFFPFHKLIKYIMKLAMGVLIMVSVFQISNINVLTPLGAKLEYDETAYTYNQIKKEFPILNWTIISPVEQYQQSMGYGWHYNLWEFVKETQIDKKDKIEFPTDYVFVIVEKRPLNQAEPYKPTDTLTIEDSQKPFPEVGSSLEKYYTVYQNRRIVEAKAYYWMEDYMKRTNNFTVYKENDVIKVYMLKQDGTKPINMAK